MKFIRYTLAIALLSSGGLFAATTTTHEKKAKYKKIETKKQPPAKKEAPKASAKDRYGKTKGSYKKMEMKKHEKGLRKPTTKPAAATKAVTAKSTGFKAETPATKPAESTASKVAGWLGLGAAGAAATKAVATQKEAGHHTGPRAEKWNHNFGPGAKGFEEGTNEYGHWVFAGYRPDWWKTNYPIYWKDVVGPLYRKTAEYQKTLGK